VFGAIKIFSFCFPFFRMEITVCVVTSSMISFIWIIWSHYKYIWSCDCISFWKLGFRSVSLIPPYLSSMLLTCENNDHKKKKFGFQRHLKSYFNVIQFNWTVRAFYCLYILFHSSVERQNGRIQRYLNYSGSLPTSK